MSPEVVALIIAGLFGTGGGVALYRARSEAPLLAAKAQAVVIANLQADNARLIAERDATRLELITERARVAELEGRG